MELVLSNRKYDIEEPGVCPHCNNGMEPILEFAISTYFNDPLGTGLYSIFKCTHRDCKRVFVAVYDVGPYNDNTLIGFLDGSPIAPHWPETIKNIPSKFITTYLQSLKAESLALDEIAGMGYRKAIEYLVKDYVLFKSPDLQGKIEDAPLASVINKNFTDNREGDLKELLQRATWLGNDMTHYLRYHESFDICDLKQLIKLVVDEIHSIEQKRFYIKNIQGKYKK